MSTPTLSLIIPTAGRASLRRTLESAAPQVLSGDECIVVGDTFDGPLPETEAICRDFPFVTYYGYRGFGHNWGHAQINSALERCTGDYILGNDDDDIWTPHAFDAIRMAARDYPGRVLLFRFRSYLGGFVFWHTPGPEWIKQGHIGGHCLVMPNIPGKIGQRTDRYEADFDQLVETLELHEEPPVWCDYIIAEQRPQ